MSAEAARTRMTHAEYCAFERAATTKHEYVAGEVFAMSGGSLEHSRLASIVGHLLNDALRGQPCDVLTSDARVRIDAVDADVYPDASVVCGRPETSPTDDHALLNPCLVVEVLSPSTEAYDRGLKAHFYRQIPSLRAYLLVAQDRPRLELQLRRTDGRWELIEAGPGERLHIEALRIDLDVDAVYERAFPN
jgi:Uma2 family endonuclease